MHATSTVPARTARRFHLPLIAVTFVLAAAENEDGYGYGYGYGYPSSADYAREMAGAT